MTRAPADRSAWISRPATPDDFDPRPRPEWMLAPWRGRPPLVLTAWEKRPPGVQDPSHPPASESVKRPAINLKQPEWWADRQSHPSSGR